MRQFLLISIYLLTFFSGNAQYQYPYNPAKAGLEESRQGMPTDYSRPGKGQSSRVSTFGTPPSPKDVTTLGGNGNTFGLRLINDASGNIYTIGQYSNEVTLGSIDLSGSAYDTYFLAKFDENTSILEAKNIIDETDTRVVVEKAENYLDGFLMSGVMSAGSATIGNQSITVSNNQAFLAYLNFDGTTNWISTYDYNANYNTSNTEIAVKNDSIFFSHNNESIELLNSNGQGLINYPIYGAYEINALAVKDDELIIGGSFYDQLSFLSAFLTTENTFEAAFIVSMSISTEVINWANNVTGATQYSATSIRNILVLDDGSYAVAGAAHTALSWDGIEEYLLEGVFLTKFLANGTLDTTLTIQSPNSGISNPLEAVVNTSSSVFFGPRDVGTIGYTDPSFSGLQEIRLIEDQLTASINDALYINDKIYFTGISNGNLFLTALNPSTLTAASTFISNGLSGYLNITSLESDGNNNTLMLAFYRGNVSFFGESLDGTPSLLVSKTDKDENIQWKTIIDHALSSTGAAGRMDVNPIDGSITIIGRALEGFAINEVNYPEITDKFILNLSKDGSLNWVTNLSINLLQSVTSDGDGSVYVSGAFDEELTVNATTYIPQGLDGFIAKLDDQGQFEWFHHLVCDGFYFTSVDANEDHVVFTTEFYEGTAEISGTTFTLNEENGHNVLGSLSPDGTMNWALTYGGDADLTDDYTYAASYCWGSDIHLNDKGEIYLSGLTGKSNVIGDTSLYSPYLYNHFAAKFDENGNLNWSRIFQTSRYASNFDETEVDALGNYYVQGAVRDTIIFENNAEFSISDEDQNAEAVYVAKLLPNGELSWVYLFEGRTLNPAAMALHGEDQFQIAGRAFGYFTLDQKYNTYDGRAYLISSCKPAALRTPTGETSVLSSETSSYSINTEAGFEGVIWTLNPTSAGTILGSGKDISIEWNNSFSGQASLSTQVANYCGYSEDGDPLIINVEQLATGVGNEINQRLSAYPNPTKESLTIVYDNELNHNISFSLYDLYGKKVMELARNVKSNQINKTVSLAGLADGSYLLVMESDNETSTRLIVKY